MKHIVLLSLVLLVGEAWGANGSNLIGASAASISLGGTGVANVTNGTDAIYKNPSLLTDIPGGSQRFILESNTTYLKLNATGSYTNTLSATDVENQGPGKLVPDLAVTYKLSDDLAVGLGIVGQGGSTSNYPSENAIAKPMSDVTYARIMPTVGYRISEQFSVGVTPFLAYGEFALNDAAPLGVVQSGRKPHGSVGFGAQVGVSYRPFKELIIGAIYASKSNFTFKELSDVEAFLGTPNGLDDIMVQQPQEYAIGFAWNAIENLTLTGDIRRIGWSSADGYQSFGWRDQTVFAVGTEYRIDKLALRVGFNYGDAPFGDQADDNVATGSIQGHLIKAKTISILNVFAFPAVAKTHITLGGGYQFTEDLGLDLGFMYVPKTEVTRTGLPVAGVTGAYSFTTKVSLWSASLGIRYRL